MNAMKFLQKLADKGQKVRTSAKGTDDTGRTYTVSADAVSDATTFAGLANAFARPGTETKINVTTVVEGRDVKASGRATDAPDIMEVWGSLAPAAQSEGGDVRPNTDNVPNARNRNRQTAPATA